MNELCTLDFCSKHNVLWVDFRKALVDGYSTVLNFALSATLPENSFGAQGSVSNTLYELVDLLEGHKNVYSSVKSSKAEKANDM